MKNSLCIVALSFLFGCSSAKPIYPLTVTHIESEVGSLKKYPNLPEYPSWVLDLHEKPSQYVAVHCGYPNSDSFDDLANSERTSGVLAKARLIKKINASEVVYSKEELNGEDYSVHVKSRTAGFLPHTEVLNSQAFRYEGRMRVCVAVGIAGGF